jgi:hypothetical protein
MNVDIPKQPTTIEYIKHEIHETTEIMKQNVEKILDRGDKIEDLRDATEELIKSSEDFKNSSKSLKRRMWWQRYKIPLAIGSISVGTIATVALITLL